jgi:hypothetical protein
VLQHFEESPTLVRWDQSDDIGGSNPSERAKA